MRNINYTALKRFSFIIIVFICGCSQKSSDTIINDVIAFSLKNASNVLQTNSDYDIIDSLAGITRIGGFIIDQENKDIILVGLADNKLPKANFDDLITALRSRIIYNEYPLVSIDPVENTYQTRQQKVRFDGHLENTHFGKMFLACDILLKKYSLQLVECIEGIPSYRDLYEKEVSAKLAGKGHEIKNILWQSGDQYEFKLASYNGLKQIEQDEYEARYWFYPMQPISYINRNDVFLIRDLNIGLEAEEVYSKSINSIKAREKFAKNWTDNFIQLCEKYQELRYLKLLYDFTAIANLMSDSLNLIRDFDFVNQFLYEYQVKKIPTPSTYKLEEVVGKIELEDGMVNLINISGGIKFGKEVKLLNYGDYGQLKNIVLTSRPSDTTLFWQLPINGWVIPNFKDIISTTHNNPDNGDKNGSYVKSQTVVVNPNVHLPINNVNSFNGFMPVHSSPPKLKGVQMKMIIDNSSFKKDSKLNSLRDSILRDVNQKH